MLFKLAQLVKFEFNLGKTQLWIMQYIRHVSVACSSDHT